MKIVKDDIVLSPKETHTDDVQASDATCKTEVRGNRKEICRSIPIAGKRRKR